MASENPAARGLIAAQQIICHERQGQKNEDEYVRVERATRTSTRLIAV